MECVIFLLTTLSLSIFATEHHPLSQEFINSLNKNASTWVAGQNFAPDVSMNYIRRLMGVLPDFKNHMPPTLKLDLEGIEIPEHFDSREKWPECPSLHEIRDQGDCCSCWAFAAVEAMTDRNCIYSGGKSNIHCSAQDLISCCDMCGYGCEGGWPGAAWAYWVDTGIVSGGSYDSHQGCKPYLTKPCEHNVTGPRPSCTDIFGPTPECQKTCEPGYSASYKNDLHFGKNAYSVVADVQQIQIEIMTNGPVEAIFYVFSDFLHYKIGVYQNRGGKYLGVHAVKILGWGVEKETPYWLIGNSWNTDWGNNGFVKFVRGINHLGIEDSISAGSPAQLQQYISNQSNTYFT